MAEIKIQEKKRSILPLILGALALLLLLGYCFTRDRNEGPAPVEQGGVGNTNSTDSAASGTGSAAGGAGGTTTPGTTTP